jgi:hypothetical protein
MSSVCAAHVRRRVQLDQRRSREGISPRSGRECANPTLRYRTTTPPNDHASELQRPHGESRSSERALSIPTTATLPQ